MLRFPIFATRSHCSITCCKNAEERAVLLDQREWIAGPIFTLRLHDVDVRQEQDGLELWIPARIYGNEAAFLGMIRRGKCMQVRVRNPGRLQARRHPIGRQRAAAGGSGQREGVAGA